MPVYEYRCGACGEQVELLQARGAGPPEDGCPSCGGCLRRLFSRVAVRYGAWGFAHTDALVSDTRGKQYKDLRERAERISDER
ncbi:MAG: FmdB family zinc ribbon protein [Egibacteraceae bacterium]